MIRNPLKEVRIAFIGCGVISHNHMRFYTKMDNVKFKNPVKPGDTLESVCTLTRSRGAFYFIGAKGYVDGKLCVSAELSFALVPNEK